MWGLNCGHRGQPADREHRMSNAHARRRGSSVSAFPKRRIIGRATQYVVEQLEQRTMLTSLSGGPMGDAGAAYTLGLTPDPWAVASGYPVNWGARQGSAEAASNTTAVP